MPLLTERLEEANLLLVIIFQLFSNPNHFQLVNSIFWDMFTLFCVKSLQVLSGGIQGGYCVDSSRKYMTAVARGIDETSNAVQLIFIICFPKVQLYLLFLNPHFLSYYFSALIIIQGFILNFLRTS